MIILTTTITIEDGRGWTAQTLSLTLFGPCNSTIVVDRYLQATITTASRLKAPLGRQGTSLSQSGLAQVQQLSSGTKHVLVFSIACWLLTCVFWACTGWDSKALVAGLLADMAIVTSAALRHVLASTNELRRDIAFAESQVFLLFERVVKIQGCGIENGRVNRAPPIWLDVPNVIFRQTFLPRVLCTSENCVFTNHGCTARRRRLIWSDFPQ